VAPTVYGQSRGRELTVLSGRGGELGVHIADARSGGVEITEVQPDGAAEKAGLKRGDVIVEFDGEKVRSGRQFARLVQETPAGRTVKATILRNGQKQDVQVTPSEGRGTAMFMDGDAFKGWAPERFGYMDRLGDLDKLRGDLDRLKDLPFNFNF